MSELVTRFIDILVVNLHNLGPIVGVMIIILEAMLPLLPFGLFITLNIEAFGILFGFLISWLSTVTGCMIAYKISFFLSYKYFENQYIYKMHNLRNLFENISLAGLVLIMSIPFIPVFFINLAAGYYRIKEQKFFLALLISKLVIVYFWAYIGATFIESLTNLRLLLKLIMIIAVVFLLSKLVSNRMDIK